MKRRNPAACDEARRINAEANRAVEYLDSDTLERHLENVSLFKTGLLNSFGVDFRSQTCQANSADGQSSTVLFNYLSEALPLVQPQANRLPKRRRAAYNKLADAAVNSFWEIYYRFQPLIHQLADKSGVDIDDLGNILGRTILLYDKNRGFKFFSYLDKTLRESVKNLRGRVYAERLMIPVSAGRLIPQILWLLDQETLRLRRSLTIDESESVVLRYLNQQPARFANATKQQIAQVARELATPISLDTDWLPKNSLGAARCDVRQHDHVGCQDQLDVADEHEFLLRRIAKAADAAMFTDRERAVLFQRLEIIYDQDLYTRVESELTAGSLRNRRAQLMVRFIAAFHSSDASRFGRFLLADPVASKATLSRAIHDSANHLGCSAKQVITALLNHLALVDMPYRVTITQRAQLESFLLAHSGASLTSISGALFHKLKAGLIDQDRQGFPCVLRSLAD